MRGANEGQVGVIGLGHMGLPIAARLAAAGYAVCGYDVSPAARNALAEIDGARVVESAANAVSTADAVILMLPTSTVVEQTLERDGVLAAMRPGALLIDMGSSDPLSSCECAARAAAVGVRFIDAPVSGGGFRGAQAGTLTIIVGGEDADVANCMPLLAHLGTTIRHVGPTGAGHTLKAINNLLSATSLLASAEAVELGRRFGLDAEVMLEVINASSGRSDSTERKLPNFVLTKSFDSGGSMKLMIKDLHNALSLAERIGAPLRLGAVTAKLWNEAAAELPPEADYTEIARWAADEHEQSG